MSNAAVLGRTVKPPFPYFGGKRKVAEEVWARFGVVNGYFEPFFGGGAVLLVRPSWTTRSDRPIETINDMDGLLVNFWRAVTLAGDEVERLADYPMNEMDLHARHDWLIENRDRITQGLMTPEFYDAKAAAWWAWGKCGWIGDGWGFHAWRGMPSSNRRGLLGNLRLIGSIAQRTRWVKTLSGDWARCLGAHLSSADGLQAVFLDPPYGEGRLGLYGPEVCGVAADVWAWAVKHGGNERYRIAVAGFSDGRVVPDGWTVHKWKAGRGFANRAASRGVNENAGRETVWFSPHCLQPSQQLALGVT